MHVLPSAELFDEIARRHGHRCPMSTLGGRLGFAARRRLPGNGQLHAQYLLRTCALDGIAAATGCSEQLGTLRVRESDRHALVLRDLRTEAFVMVELTARALALAGEYRRRDASLTADWERLSGDARKQRVREKENYLDDLLQRLRTLPEPELIAVQDASLMTEASEHA